MAIKLQIGLVRPLLPTISASATHKSKINQERQPNPIHGEWKHLLTAHDTRSAPDLEWICQRALDYARRERYNAPKG